MSSAYAIKGVCTPDAMLCDGIVDRVKGMDGFIVSGEWVGVLPAVGAASELYIDLIGPDGRRYELKMPVICTGHEPATFVKREDVQDA